MVDDIRIEHANIEHVDTIYAYGSAEKAFAVTDGDGFWDKCDIEHFIQHEVVLVAVHTGKVVGFAIAIHNPIKSCIENMYVSKAFRGRHIAQLLLTHTEKELIKLQTKYIVSETLSSSVEMMNLLKKTGYFEGKSLTFWLKVASSTLK